MSLQHPAYGRVLSAAAIMLCRWSVNAHTALSLQINTAAFVASNCYACMPSAQGAPALYMAQLVYNMFNGSSTMPAGCTIESGTTAGSNSWALVYRPWQAGWLACPCSSAELCRCTQLLFLCIKASSGGGCGPLLQLLLQARATSRIKCLDSVKDAFAALQLLELTLLSCCGA